MTSFALYIKRAEEFHTKEFIADVFHRLMCGQVSDVKFIEKHGVMGQKYFGVIVHFYSWINNEFTTKLMNQMASSGDGTTKLFYDLYSKNYWHIMIHQEKEQKQINCESLNINGLSDTEKAVYLENMVREMSAQLQFYKTKCERQDVEITNLENLVNLHEVKNNELEYEHNLEIEEKNKEIEMWRALANTTQELFNEEKEKREAMEQDFQDNECIMNFLQGEMESMRGIISNGGTKRANNNKTKLPLIEELM